MSLILPLSFFSSVDSSPPFLTLDTIYHIIRPNTSFSSRSFIFGNSTTYQSGLSGIGLLNTYNSLDPVFKPYVDPNINYSIRTAVLSSGNSGDYKFIIGGKFDLAGGSRTNLCILRLSAGAPLTPDFGFFSTFTTNLPQYNAIVYDMVMTNRIYVVGDFDLPNRALATYNFDGTVSTVFRWDIFGDSAHCIKSDGLGNVFIGGKFSTVSNSVSSFTRTSIVKMNTTGIGSVVTNFNPASIITNPGTTVRCIEVMADGRVIVGSEDYDYTNKGLIRLPSIVNTSSTNYESFDTLVGARIADVTMIKIDNNGKLLACLRAYGLVRLYRFNIAGVTPITLDTTFGGGDGFISIETATVGDDKYVYSIDIDSSDNIILGGNFDRIDGKTRKSFAVLNNSGTLLNL